MPRYIRTLQMSNEGTAAIKGHIEQVYSPHDATEFSYGDASFFRQKAFEEWPNSDWEIKEVASGKYHVMTRT